MIDLLLEPAKLFIEGGLEKFKASKELKNLSLAMRDRIRREVQFNLAILEEALKKKEKSQESKNDPATIAALVLSLKTGAFDAINEGAIPVDLMIDGTLNKQGWPKGLPQDADIERYMQYLMNVNSLVDLLDRTYYRIAIAKTLAACHKSGSDLGYIRFMLLGLKKELLSAD